MQDITIKSLGKQDKRHASPEHNMAGLHADLDGLHIKQIICRQTHLMVRNYMMTILIKYMSYESANHDQNL